MSAATLFKLANGKDLDLRDPKIELADFDALAEQLAKEVRYNGSTPGVQYSAAEHSCLGADAVLAAGLGDQAAAYFLCHDLHEAVWKDDTTPKKRALAETATLFGILARDILAAFDLCAERIDAAVHAAAGLKWPAPDLAVETVNYFDKVMFVTEWRDLMGDAPHPHWEPYAGIAPLPEKIGAPWPWRTAKAGWLRRAHALLPALRALAIEEPLP